MSQPSKQRAGKERIESLGIPKPRWVQWWQQGDKTDLVVRIGIVLVGAIAILAFCETWRPPFAFREGMIPARELITRVRMEVPDETQTDKNREKARSAVLAYYRNSPQPLDQLKESLTNKLLEILTAKSFDEMTPQAKATLGEFNQTTSDDAEPVSLEKRFQMFKEVFKEDPELKSLKMAIEPAINLIREHGVLVSLQHTVEQGDQQSIRVFLSGLPDEAKYWQAETVRIAQAGPEFQRRLADNFRQRFDGSDDYREVATMVGDWFVAQLPDNETLTYDDERTELARQKAESEVEPATTVYRTGKTKLADAGEELTSKEVDLLHREWSELVSKMRWADLVARVSAYAGLIIALCLLCGSYIWFVDDRSLLTNRWELAKLMAVMVCTIVAGYWLPKYVPRVELIPLVLGSIVAAVVYGRELALLLMATAAVSLTLFIGGQLSDLVVLAAACTTCTLLVGRIRTRTHLLYVGTISAAVTMATVVGVGVVTGQTLSGGDNGLDLEPLYRGPQFDMVVWGLFKEAFWIGSCIVVSAATLTPFLPIVEKAFGVQTDLSLLEMGDASHPLLRRLAQRAPGTYNHSINVASIAEAAADSIGANGLLVRVGAYFHDIGKMFKPEYFIENQAGGVNQHDSLQPAMSTLVIIAHVKDGADLARSHHLPEPIIDFILQHHGTTLVEYFYREAARRSEEDPNRESVSDKDFRYPGPKPKTLEAAVLMLADTVESASRTLVDPTPARIQGLVDAIAQKKVADGQFDDCGLTFQQLHRVRASLVKSLTAIYHARVKYPGQQSA